MADKTPPENLVFCALCKNVDFQNIQTQSLYLVGRAEPNVLHFGVCTHCGHLQQTPPVPSDLMAYHYRTFASYEHFGDSEQLRRAEPSRHAKRLLSLAKDIGLKPGKAYEVGCAIGEMLNQFRKNGWTVSGCDPSPSAVAQGKSIFDITIDLDNEETALPRQAGLDLILVSHVLEHLYDPAATLKRFHDALADNGHLLFELPCAAFPEMLPVGWFTFEHLHYYQPSILTWLLQETGFELIEMRIATRVEHYPVVTVAARKSERRAQAQAPADPRAAIAMAQTYAQRDAAIWKKADDPLNPVTGPIYIWGAGIHTAQLLDFTSLGKHAQIIAIVDRDSKKWGNSFAGFPIISPDALFAAADAAPIVISSYVSEAAIMRGLLDGGVAPARIVPIYGARPGT